VRTAIGCSSAASCSCGASRCCRRSSPRRSRSACCLRILPIPAWTVALPAAIVVALAVGPLQTLRWRRWSWRLTDRAVELRSGVVTRRHVVVPHFRVQQIDVLEGPIERLLGLATLRVTTASATGSVDLPGLSASVAPGVRGELLARAARANLELGRDGRDAV
jgi:uncharacterized protein